jgi:hypothetical protein
MVCKYKENAETIWGSSENAKCLIPVNHVPETGSFQLVLDNEGIADTQDALILTTNVNPDPEQIYMVRLSYVQLKIASGNDADGMRARVGGRRDI